LLRIKDTKSKLWQLVKGPSFNAKTYRKYRASGFISSPKSHDDKVVTQDSGVCMEAITTCASSKKDKNHVDAPIMYYGVIQQILEVDYIDFQEVVFYCDWVKVEDRNNGCKMCPDSNLVMVNFNKLKSVDKYTDEPVILACEASQVFYSNDLKNPDWWVVIRSPRRLTNQVDKLDEPTDFQSTIKHEPHLNLLLKCVR